MAVLAACALLAALLPGTALAIDEMGLDSECATNNRATVELSFGSDADNADTLALIREVRARLGLNPDSPRDLRSASTAPPSYMLDTAGLPDLCINWSIYGYPNGEGQDASGRTYGFGRPYTEQFLIDTVQIFVPSGSEVNLATALRTLTDPGCDYQTDLYIGETLGDDEQAAPHDDGGPGREGPDGGNRAEVLIAYGVNYNDPAVPCGSAPATTSLNCVEDPPGTGKFDNRLNVVIIDGTETGTYELLVDGVVVDTASVVVSGGTPPQDIQLTAIVTPGTHTVQVLLNGEAIVVDGAPGQRIPDGDGIVDIVAEDCPPLLGAIGDLVWSDLDGDGLQDDDEPGVEGVTVRLTDCDDDVLQTQTTDGDGNYLFDGLAPGCYRVVFVPPGDTHLTSRDAGNNANDAIDSDADRTTGRSHDILLDPGEVDLTIDAGLVTASVDIVTTTFIPDDGGGTDVCVAPDGGGSKPTTLIFEYIGDTTQVISQQDPGKASAQGAVGALPANVAVADGDATVSGDNAIDAIGDRVTVVGTKGGGEFSSNTIVTVGGQTIEFHTSCSQPLLLGDQYGSLKLVGFTNRDGASGEVTPPGSPYGIDGAMGTIGQPVTWYHLVTNPGPLSLDNLVVTDDAGTPMDPTDDLVATFVEELVGNGDELLDPGETWVYATQGTVDVVGRYDNSGTVVGDGVGTNGEVLVPDVTATDPTWYFGNYTGEDVCETFEKPRAMTFVYTGNSVLDSDQDPGKAEFTNTSAYTVPATAYIIVSEDDDPTQTEKRYFAGTVALGEELTALASTAGRSEFSSSTFFFIYDSPGGALLQFGEFHTSCSQPLALGNQFGDLQLTGFTDKNGNSPSGAGAGDGGVDPVGADLCDTYDKPAVMTFTFTDTSALITAQNSDKASFTGTTSVASAYVIISEDDDPSKTEKHYVAATVSVGETITAVALNAGRNEFGSETHFFVYSAPGGSLLQSGAFHTSCSQPLAIADQYGNLVLAGFTDKDADSTPGTITLGVRVGGTVVDGNKLDVELQNLGPAVIIDSVDVSWPTSPNGGIKKVKLDGDTLYETLLTGGTATAPGADGWKEGPGKRTIDAMRAEDLRLEFQNDIAGSGYTITVHFANGSSVTATR